MRQALAQHGLNALPQARPATLLQRLLRQFRSPLIYILLVALLIDIGIWMAEGATGVPVESLAIALILVLNAGLGVYQESHDLLRPSAVVADYELVVAKLPFERVRSPGPVPVGSNRGSPPAPSCVLPQSVGTESLPEAARPCHGRHDVVT